MKKSDVKGFLCIEDGQEVNVDDKIQSKENTVLGSGLLITTEYLSSPSGTKQVVEIEGKNVWQLIPTYSSDGMGENNNKILVSPSEYVTITKI